MKFSIITPTVQRESLIKCCESVNEQSGDWEHIVMVDSGELNSILMLSLAHPKRKILQCSTPHRNGGNTCRADALKHATGDYCAFMDDDNYYHDADVFKDIEFALEEAGRPPWALFPICRLGGIFYCDPPRSCHVDTMNFILRRDIAYWPDTDAYGTDGILVDDLMARGVPYASFPAFRPIAVMPVISFARS